MSGTTDARDHMMPVGQPLYNFHVPVIMKPA